MTQEKDKKLSRRDLLKTGTLGGLGIASLSGAHEAIEARANAELVQGAQTKNSSVIGMRFEPRAVVRVGIIGFGNRGPSHLRDLLSIDKAKSKPFATSSGRRR